MSFDGFYYLTEDGQLIPTTEEPANDDSAYVCIWPVDSSDRYNAWKIATEALALGADKERIKELAEKWDLTDLDAHTYAQLTGIPLEKDGNVWFAGGDEARGEGETALEALAMFVKEYMPIHQELAEKQTAEIEESESKPTIKKVVKPIKRKQKKFRF